MRIMYLCDGNVPECKKTHCYKNTDGEACRHTSDVKHAVNFKEGGNTGTKGNYWEMIRDTEEVGHVDTTDYDVTELP